MTPMKKALKTFGNEIAVSAGDPAKLAKFGKKRLSSSLRYLFWFLFCLSLATTLWVCLSLSLLIPRITPFVDSATSELRSLYPANLVVKVQGGRLSTNGREPVQIDLPPKLKKAFADNPGKNKKFAGVEHLVVIDTKAETERFYDYHTLMLLTDRSMVVADDYKGGVRVIPYEAGRNIMVTRQSYVQIVDAAAPFVRSLPALASSAVIFLGFVLPFVIAGTTWLWYLVYLLVATLAALLLAKMMGRKHTYGELYRLGAYAITLPLLYNAVTLWIPFLRYPFVFTLIFLVWMGLVFGSEKVRKRKEA